MSVRNQTIKFLRQEITRDELGQEKPQWVNSGYTALASASLASGKLYYEAARANEENTMLFVCRFAFLPSDFNKIDYRILYKGKTYRIKQFSVIKERGGDVQIRGVTV